MDELRGHNDGQEPNEPLCVVFDMPVTASPEEAARLLEGHYTRGFYASAVVEWPGAGMRVFMRRYAKSDKPKSAEPSQTKEARAVQFLRDNREMPSTQLYAAFKAIGFPRSTAWINSKRNEIVKAERRVG